MAAGRFKYFEYLQHLPQLQTLTIRYHPYAGANRQLLNPTTSLSPTARCSAIPTLRQIRVESAGYNRRQSDGLYIWPEQLRKWVEQDLRVRRDCASK